FHFCASLFLVGCGDVAPAPHGTPLPPLAASSPSLRPLAPRPPGAQQIQACARPFAAGDATLPGDHRAVWGADASAVYVVWDEVLRLDGLVQTSPVTTALNSIFGTAADDLYAAGDAGVVLHSGGDGTWQRLFAP